MQQSKGEYDDRSDIIDNIFEVLQALCKIDVDILENMDASDEMNMLIISLVHSKGYVQEKRCAFHL
jgi:hypothetical protein